MCIACHSLMERSNQTLTTRLIKTVNSDANDWDDHLDSILFGYRVKIQASTKFSPFELLYRVKPRLPIDLDGASDVDDTADECDDTAVRVK